MTEDQRESASNLFTPTPPTLDDYMGEGKKYSDNNAVAKALFEKDAFIEKLQSENAEMRTDLTARTSIEDLLEKANQRPPEAPPEEKQNLQPQEPAPSIPELTPTNMREEVLKLLGEEKAKDSRETNISLVRTALTERFGPNYNKILEEVADTLGISKTFLSDMASTSPSGLFKLVESVVPKDDKRPTAPPATTLDTHKEFGTVVRKNSAYYSSLRQSDLKAYLSKNIQTEMHDEAMRQGSSFFEK